MSGDSIVGLGGQPGAPFTGSVGLQYHFAAFDKQSFVRADYEYVGAPKWAGPNQDPASGQYDQANYSLPSTSFLTLRGGMQLGEWNASIFMDNVTNTHPVTNYDWSIDPLNGPNSYLDRVPAQLHVPAANLRSDSDLSPLRPGPRVTRRHL